MRIQERFDAGLIASECLKFWQDAGYRHVRVMAGNGSAKVTFLSGRWFKPPGSIRRRWREQKVLGVCYTVERVVLGRITLWDSKNWDTD